MTQLGFLCGLLLVASVAGTHYADCGDVPVHELTSNTACVGYGGGQPFVARGQDPLAFVTRMVVHYCDQLLSHIDMDFADGSVVRNIGNRRCSKTNEIFTLSTGALGIGFTDNIFIGASDNRVRHVTLKTFPGELKIGDDTIDRLSFQAQGCYLMGFFGRSGDNIDALGFIISQKPSISKILLDKRVDLSVAKLADDSVQKKSARINFKNIGGDPQAVALSMNTVSDSESCSAFSMDMGMSVSAGVGLGDWTIMGSFGGHFGFGTDSCETTSFERTIEFGATMSPFTDCQAQHTQMYEAKNEPYSGLFMLQFAKVQYAHPLEEWEKESEKYIIKEFTGMSTNVKVHETLSYMDCQPTMYATDNDCSGTLQHVKCATVATDKRAPVLLDESAFVYSAANEQPIVLTFKRPDGERGIWVLAFALPGAFTVNGLGFPMLADNLSWQYFGLLPEGGQTVTLSLTGEAVIGGVYFGEDDPVGLLGKCVNPTLVPKKQNAAESVVAQLEELNLAMDRFLMVHNGSMPSKQAVDRSAGHAHHRILSH